MQCRPIGKPEIYLHLTKYLDQKYNNSYVKNKCSGYFVQESRNLSSNLPTSPLVIQIIIITQPLPKLHTCIVSPQSHASHPLLQSNKLSYFTASRTSRQGGRSCAKARRARTKILSSNIHYYVAILGFVAIGSKQCCFWQEVHYYIVHIAYYAELNLLICKDTRNCQGQ